MVTVLFATAELAPAARVGGLAEAASGLVRQLRADGVDVDLVLPDYDDRPLDDEVVGRVDLPGWAMGDGRTRTGTDPDIGPVTFVRIDDEPRPHPYFGPDGEAWPQLDHRFLSFSAAVAALVVERAPDVVHLNDWHTSAALAFLGDDAPPSVLTIHTLGHQGQADGEWLDRLPAHRADFEWYDTLNPLRGAIRLADRIIAVSPNYAREILTTEHGAGMDVDLAGRGDALVGIRNGIDVDTWNPRTDTELPERFHATRMGGRATCRAALAARAGWEVSDDEPTIGVVTRLVDQKGVDLLLEATRYLPTMPARLFVLGSGDAQLASWLSSAMAMQPDRIHFVDGYDASLAHLIFAGSDLFAMPSRFEPCGLAQMQAMAYGSLPVVTDVGGLHDTVTDADRDPDAGTGILCPTVDVASLVDGLHRGTRLWRDKKRRRAAQRVGMTTDWSWAAPAAAHAAIYDDLR